jgi:hypothetical protein
MTKFKKVAAPLIVAGFIFSAAAGNVSAAESNNESPTINWDEAWSSVDSDNNISDATTFGTSSNSNGTGFSTLSWGSLATGSTALSSGSGSVTSTGKTTGKVIGTVTSATTSLRISGMGYITGPKKTAIGKFTSTSQISTTNPSGKQTFEGLTVHTATDSGVLYQSRTYASGTY